MSSPYPVPDTCCLEIGGLLGGWLFSKKSFCLAGLSLPGGVWAVVLLESVLLDLLLSLLFFFTFATSPLLCLFVPFMWKYSQLRFVHSLDCMEYLHMAGWKSLQDFSFWQPKRLSFPFDRSLLQGF